MFMNSRIDISAEVYHKDLFPHFFLIYINDWPAVSKLFIQISIADDKINTEHVRVRSNNLTFIEYR